jgi:hypothetical protein
MLIFFDSRWGYNISVSNEIQPLATEVAAIIARFGRGSEEARAAYVIAHLSGIRVSPSDAFHLLEINGGAKISALPVA